MAKKKGTNPKKAKPEYSPDSPFLESDTETDKFIEHLEDIEDET